MVQLVWCALNLLNIVGIGNFFGKRAEGTTAQAFALGKHSFLGFNGDTLVSRCSAVKKIPIYVQRGILGDKDGKLGLHWHALIPH